MPSEQQFEAPSEGVNALAVDQQVLKQFWNLASLEQDVRQEAVTALAQAVSQESDASLSHSGDTQALTAPPSDTIADGQPAAAQRSRSIVLAGCSPVLAYTLDRLVRGLASNRQGARQGFSLALTAIVRQNVSLTAATCVRLMQTALTISNGMTGSEAKDVLLAHVFGCAALVRTGKVQHAADASEVASILLNAAEKKAFLREIAAEVLQNMLDNLEDEAVVQQLLTEHEVLRKYLLQDPAQAQPEALLLALRLWRLMPAELSTSCQLLPQLGSSKADWEEEASAAFFAAGHLSKLLPVLRNTTAAHPRLHLLWPTLLALLLPGFTPVRVAGSEGSKRAARAGQMEAFWTTVVEGDLFASSNERKYLGFQLFTILLPHLTTEQVPAVFSPNFMRCLNNHRSSQATALHSAAKRCIQRITTLLHSPEVGDAHLQAAVSAALKRHNATGFGSLGTAQAEAAAALGAEEYVQQLQQAFMDSSGSGSDTQRQQLIEQLCGAFRLAAAGSSVQLSALRFMALHALFDAMPGAADKGAQAEVRQMAASAAHPVSRAVHDLAASRLLSLLGHTSKPSSSKGAAKDAKTAPDAGASAADRAGDAAAAVDAAAQDSVAVVAEYVQSLQGSNAVAPARRPSEEQAAVAATLQGATPPASVAAPTGTDSKREERKRQHAWRHLLQLLQLYQQLQPGFLDADAATDLAVISAKGFGGPATDVDTAGSDGEGEGEEEVVWQDALLDVMLALLSRPADQLPSAPLRDAVDALFRAVSPQLTPTGLQDLIRVLTEYEEGGGPKEDLLEAEDMSEDEDSGTSSSEEEDDEGDESGSDAGSEGEQFNRMVDAAGQPEGDASDEEPSMGDDQMFQMDQGLAAAVRAAADAKPNAKERRQQMLNFKFRVVALLEMYVKRVPDSIHLPAMVPPLLQAVERAGKPSGSAALAERLQGLIGKLCRSKAAASGRGLPAEDASTLLETVLFTVAREGDKRTTAAAGSAFRYLLHVAQGAADQPAEPVMTAIRRAMDDFFGSKKSRLPRALLQGCLRDCPSAAAGVLGDVLGRVADARTPFLKAEALALLSALLRPPKAHAAVMADALQGAASQLVSATAATLSTDFGKVQRQIEALKALGSSWEAALNLRRHAAKPFKVDKAALAQMEAAISRATAAEPAPSPKVQTQLSRLSQLMESARKPATEATKLTLTPANAPVEDAAAAVASSPKKGTGQKRVAGEGARKAKKSKKEAA